MRLWQGGMKMGRQENEAVLLQKLNALTDAWKAMQVSLGYNPDIPLQWSVEDSILFWMVCGFALPNLYRWKNWAIRIPL